MTSYAKPLVRLLDALERLPGIGPRSAERIAFYLLRLPKEEARQLAQAIADVKEQLRFCEICFNLSEGARCAVCEDPTRDASLLCVVEEPKDVLSIEKTGTFRGLYHVLLGAIAPLDGIGPELLKIDALMSRVSDGAVQEVVLATDGRLHPEPIVHRLHRGCHERIIPRSWRPRVCVAAAHRGSSRRRPVRLCTGR